MEEACRHAVPPIEEAHRRARGGHHARGARRGVVEAPGPGGGEVEAGRIRSVVSVHGGAVAMVVEWPVVELRWWWSGLSGLGQRTRKRGWPAR
jgi:hypothetical protein